MNMEIKPPQSKIIEQDETTYLLVALNTNNTLRLDVLTSEPDAVLLKQSIAQIPLFVISGYTDSVSAAIKILCEQHYESDSSAVKISTTVREILQQHGTLVWSNRFTEN